MKVQKGNEILSLWFDAGLSERFTKQTGSVFASFVTSKYIHAPNRRLDGGNMLRRSSEKTNKCWDNKHKVLNINRVAANVPGYSILASCKSEWVTMSRLLEWNFGRQPNNNIFREWNSAFRPVYTWTANSFSLRSVKNKMRIHFRTICLRQSVWAKAKLDRRRFTTFKHETFTNIPNGQLARELLWAASSPLAGLQPNVPRSERNKAGVLNYASCLLLFLLFCFDGFFFAAAAAQGDFRCHLLHFSFDYSVDLELCEIIFVGCGTCSHPQPHLLSFFIG